MNGTHLENELFHIGSGLDVLISALDLILLLKCISTSDTEHTGNSRLTPCNWCGRLVHNILFL